MSEAIQQIAERLRGLRDVLEISVEEMAEVCRLTPEEYLRLESGTADISIDMLHTIARKYGVEPITLMFGDEPKMSTYFVTRSGRGASVERTKAYKYQSLAAGFLSRRADPFMVTVHPKPEGTPIFLNLHIHNHDTIPLKIIWAAMLLLTAAMIVTGCVLLWTRKYNAVYPNAPKAVRRIGASIWRAPVLIAVLSVIGLFAPITGGIGNIVGVLALGLPVVYFFYSLVRMNHDHRT